MEEVILVNEADIAVGTMEKIEAHQKALLHRAFSVFIFDTQGRMLLQRRADGKYHSPGLWTNACCSHPRPGEDTEAAAIRRLHEELGFTTPLTRLFSFTYRSEYDNGLTEFEFDHVFVGHYDISDDVSAGAAIHPNPEEVSDYCYRSMEDIRTGLQADPASYTTWFHLAFPMVNEKYKG
jgi:isopentenyl-diphosphate delta-isomerase